MAPRTGPRQRKRGSVRELPSGALQVRVTAGKDPITGRRHELVEVIPPGPKAAEAAEAARTRLLHQVDERRHPRTNATVNQLLDRHFEHATLAPATLDTYRGYADNHVRPLIGREPVGSLDASVFDAFYTELRRCRHHCDRRPRVDHRTPLQHECDERCRPHVCRPLGDSTIRQIHFIMSGALRRAVRLRWIGTSPIDQAEPPPAPKPDPRPPTAAEAARVLHEAWADAEWALLLWLAMVTGARRGELCALRWHDVDLAAGVLWVRRSIWQRGKRTGEKDTKDHQKRRIALDVDTLALLVEHRERCEERITVAGVELRNDAFLFSSTPDGRRYLLPDSVSQRYGDLVRRLGIHTSIHKLRHYSATELISAGVNPRTVAGRLGHGGAGTTTLRYYTAWVSEADQRAATTLSGRMPARPAPGSPVRSSRALYPYERVAAVLRARVVDGDLAVGSFLPGQKQLAAEHGIAVGTAHRAAVLLAAEGTVRPVSGRGFEVVTVPSVISADESAEITEDPPAAVEAVGAVLLDLVVRRAGAEVARFSAEGDPDDPQELRELLLDAVLRRGEGEDQLRAYELQVFRAGRSECVRTFVASSRRRATATS
ncbi:MAG: tyrosine-type recombinase/integrase [Pseudonocardia sp.]